MDYNMALTPQRRAELAMLDVALHSLIQYVHNLLNTAERLDPSKLPQIELLRSKTEQSLENAQLAIASGKSIDFESLERSVKESIAVLKAG
jgi:hypothetical protein